MPLGVVTSWLGWVPALGGTLGCLVGGVLADRVSRLGGEGRTVVLLACCLLAAPCLALAVSAPAPLCFVALLPGYLIGEVRRDDVCHIRIASLNHYDDVSHKDCLP